MRKTKWIFLAAALAIVYLLGIWTGKAIYDKPINGKVEHDTVIVHDTVPDIAPTPKDSVRIKWMTRWLPTKHDTIPRTDTIYQPIGGDNMVAVEVPITQKHYGNDTYDAWVSGFEPSLDSIKIYQKTQYITTTVTKVKPPNKYSLTINAGVDYGASSQFFQPYAFGKLTLNNDKMIQLGIKGGVKKNEMTNKFEPVFGAEAKIKLH